MKRKSNVLQAFMMADEVVNVNGLFSYFLTHRRLKSFIFSSTILLFVSMHHYLQLFCLCGISGDCDGVNKTRSTEKPAICRPPVRPPEPPSRHPPVQKTPSSNTNDGTQTS